jgi:hypothetical protein
MQRFWRAHCDFRSRRNARYCFAIPAGVNPKDYPSLIIWCERFGVLISPADLRIAVAAKGGLRLQSALASLNQK